MKIAYLLADPGIPVGGTKGASVHVREVTAELVRQGHRVLLCAQRVVGPAPEGVELIELDPGPVPRAEGADAARLAAALNFAQRSAAVVRDFEPDLVYERLALMWPGAAVLATELGTPRLVEVNAPVADEWARHRGLRLREAATRGEDRALAGTEVVAVSEPLARWAMTRGARRATVITNGVDPRRFRVPTSLGDAAQRRTLRLGLGLRDAEVVGFVGSLKPWHGVDILIDAVSRLARTRPALRLLIVGDGPQRAVLAEQVTSSGLTDRVVFTGAVPADAVPRYVAAVDVAAAPYLPADDFYFSPMKVAEAMACGRPVVASRIGPIESMTGDAALLVEPGDPVALAAAIVGLLEDPARRVNLGVAARRRALGQLSWERVVECTLSLVPTPTVSS